MNNKGIKLNMDMAYMSIMNGTAKQISKGNDEEYVTRVDMLLPLTPDEIACNNYKVDFKGRQVEIILRLIENQDSDPLFNFGKNFQIGTSNQSGLPETLSFETFTDNRGKYPVILASIVFPFRIATWLDDSHETGLKMDQDYEAIQVTGIPDNQEKIKALVIINRLLIDLGLPNEKKLKYDDVTVFSEVYFKKGNFSPIATKVNALTSKDAYKKAIEDYYLSSLDKTEVLESIEKVHDFSVKKPLANEEDLYELVNKTIDEVLIHNIEYRRWIEPFWDGERKVNIDGTEHIIPRTPKNEPKIQPTLHVILDMALRPLGIHVLRESDEGIGLLDFRFLYTTNENIPISVGVEFKVAHHKKIKHGITRQLPAYLKSIRSNRGTFAVMWFKDEKYFKEPKDRDLGQMETWLNEEAERISKELDINISSKIINASIRPSASSE